MARHHFDAPRYMQIKYATPLTLRATSAVLWSAMEIAVRYGLQFVVTVVLARLLTPRDFGLIAMLLVFTTFASLLSEGGLGSALVQKQDTTPDDETSVFIFNLVVSVFFSAVLWSAAPAISEFYSQPILESLLRAILIALPLGALSAVPNAILTQRLDFRSRTVAEVFSSVLSAALALLLAFLDYGVWSLVWQIVAATGLRACFLWWLSGWRPDGRFNLTSFGRLFRFGGFLLMANALNVFSVRLQSLLLGRIFDPRTLGLYVLAQDTQQAPAQFVTSLLNRVGLPMFSLVAVDPPKLTAALRLSLRVSLFAFAPCMIFIAATASPLVLMLYGYEWEPAGNILSILAISAVFWPLHVLNIAALSAMGRSDLVLKLEIAKGIVCIPLIIFSAPFGVEAVAWSIFVSSLLSVVVNTWWSEQLLGLGLRSQIRELVPTLLSAIISGLLAHWIASEGSNTVSSLVFGILTATIVYAGVAAIFDFKAWQDSVELLRAFRSRTNSTGSWK